MKAWDISGRPAASRRNSAFQTDTVTRSGLRATVGSAIDAVGVKVGTACFV